jgi:uncharacterized protein YbjT (DUF2867 family)
MTTQASKRILVFGATGGTGTAIVQAAVKRGYKVTAFVRDIIRAQELFKELEPHISFTEGDAFSPDDVQQAIEKDFAAVISSLGIYHALPGHDELTRATVNILAATSAAGIHRFICISSLGVGDSRGQGDFSTRLIQKTGLRFTLQDKESQEAAIRDSDLDWTIIRPTRLMNEDGPAGYKTWQGATPDDIKLWAINRSQVAELALECLTENSNLHTAVNVTGRE